MFFFFLFQSDSTTPLSLKHFSGLPFLVLYNLFIFSHADAIKCCLEGEPSEQHSLPFFSGLTDAVIIE